MDIVESLSQHLQLTPNVVKAFLLRAPNKYKIYSIPKRAGGRRTIAQPSKELKIYQSAFLELFTFPINSSSMAYVKGVSIKDNAQMHRYNSFLLKMDLENFFNSITPELLFSNWSKSGVILGESDELHLKKLLFWCPSKRAAGKHILSVGAPSSPSISNSVMCNFDELMQKICKEKQIVYTRYADDMTFSTKHKDILFQMPKMVELCLRSHFGNNILINNQKTIFSSQAHNRHVTGVTIDNNSNLSLGRNRKRYIKHLIHQYMISNLDEKDLEYVCGLLAHAKHIEPLFLKRLESKYSHEVIQNLLKRLPK
jgi:RNA-directed DNA polymerase